MIFFISSNFGFVAIKKAQLQFFTLSPAYYGCPNDKDTVTPCGVSKCKWSLGFCLTEVVIRDSKIDGVILNFLLDYRWFFDFSLLVKAKIRKNIKPTKSFNI